MINDCCKHYALSLSLDLEYSIKSKTLKNDLFLESWNLKRSHEKRHLSVSSMYVERVVVNLLNLQCKHNGLILFEIPEP